MPDARWRTPADGGHYGEGSAPSLPILLTRTPYGVPTQEEFDKGATKNGAEWLPTNWKELAADGYIFSARICAGGSSQRASF